MSIIQKMTSPNVVVIPATKRSVQNGGQLKKQTNLRVAAYCRVSTGDETQQTSYTNQKAFYTGFIQGKEGWRFAGLYADEAISGTSRARRIGFNRMIEDAKSGKMDYIMTKSISRFARNTVDTLNCVRELRKLSPPVGIYFEKENIDTLDATGELILTILSALAQDESRSISDNIRWTFQKKFQAGIPQINLNRMLGYDKLPDGTWGVNPEQARTVRFIFEHYVKGKSSPWIAAQLNARGWKTVNGKNWIPSGVLTILKNEKYVGDLAMQKTVTKDFLTHRSTINNGDAPRYYIKNHHESIVDRVTWNKVQAMLYGKPHKVIPIEIIKPNGPKTASFRNLVCTAILPEEGTPCGEMLSRMVYSGVARHYTDERSLAATGDDPSEYLEKYLYAYPVWRCRRKLGERPSGREEFSGQEGTFGQEGVSRKEKVFGRESSAVRKDSSVQESSFHALNASGKDGDSPQKLQGKCPSTVLYECALEQSFMEMLYAFKRDYLRHGEESEICRLFQEAYDEVYEKVRANSVSIHRMEILDMQIREMEEELQKTMDKQVIAMRMLVLENNEELSRALVEGEITVEDIDINLRNRLNGSNLEIQWLDVEVEEGSEADIYGKLAEDIRQRLEEFRRERTTLEAEQGVTNILKKNFAFFLECLKELPETNEAGLRMNVFGLGREEETEKEIEGGKIEKSAGDGAEEKIGAKAEGEMENKAEDGEAYDYLRFEKGIYAAFILSGEANGDEIQYRTNFGVKLKCTGNRRTLKSFLGFRKCHEDGQIEILDELWKVNGSKIQYRRTPRKKRKGGKEEKKMDEEK